jgi:hypothetical protein
MKAYIKPAKSSAEGGIKNLNLPLFLPLFLALAAENFFCLPTPLVSSNIMLKSESIIAAPSSIISDNRFGASKVCLNR